MNDPILIIGASSGIGFALASELLSQGRRVVAWSRSEGQLGGLQGVEFRKFDVTDPGSIPQISGSLGGLAYCPGTIALKPFSRLTDEDFLSDYTVNVLGGVRVLRQVLPNLKEAGNASVVLFSTVAVQTGMPFHGSIAAAKGAVEGLTRALAAELAPGIRVNCIAPSLTDTPLAERLLNTPEKRESSAKRHPMRRIGNPSDIAALAAFLLSERSGWMTGQVLPVDGGIGSLR